MSSHVSIEFGLGDLLDAAVEVFAAAAVAGDFVKAERMAMVSFYLRDIRARAAWR